MATTPTGICSFFLGAALVAAMGRTLRLWSKKINRQLGNRLFYEQEQCEGLKFEKVPLHMLP